MKPITAVSVTAHLIQVVDDFCDFVESLPSSPVPAAAQQSDAWGVAETLAHIVYHHEIYAAQAEAAVTGQPAPLPKGTFNELNALAANLLGCEPLPVLTFRLRAANAKLCRLYDEHDLAEVAIRVKKGSTAWKLSNLLPAVASHIQTHHKQFEN